MATQPDLVGGAACLDFANTVGPRHPGAGEPRHDYVPGHPELIAWAEHAGVLTPAQRRHLTRAATADPDGAEAALRRAHHLREAVYTTFSALAEGRPAPDDALAAIHDAYLAALRAARLAPAGARLDWRWPDDDSLDRILWPIARSAVELATDGPLDRIRQCPGDDGRCGWLFVDTSKSGTRRWCSMRTCGGRVKSRRQAARRRGGAR